MSPSKFLRIPCTLLANHRKIPEECRQELYLLQSEIDVYATDPEDHEAKATAINSAQSFCSYVERVKRRLDAEEEETNNR